MLATLKALELPGERGWELRKAIQADGARNGDGGRGAAATAVVAMLTEARGRVDDWPLERDSFSALEDGLERTYRRGRRDFKAVRANPTVEGLHEWRKRVKELWYHHTVLRPLWRPVMEAMGDEAHELADRLGDDHDLAVLADWVRRHADADPEFFAAVERRRSVLEADALTLGERIYADKPSAYVRRLRRLWKAAPASVRAP
jgi:CHAD domain-containing protein